MRQDAPSQPHRAGDDYLVACNEGERSTVIRERELDGHPACVEKNMYDYAALPAIPSRNRQAVASEAQELQVRRFRSGQSLMIENSESSE